MYRLENWYFEKNKDRYRVWGNVFGHPHFIEGQWISTSTLKEIRKEEDALIMTTGHSQYCARFEDHQRVDSRVLKKALHDYLWPEDEGLCQKILYESGKKTKNEKETPASCSTCAVIVFEDGFKELILKLHGHEKAVSSYDIHKGLFQDVTELSDPELGYCFRFYAYQKNGYQFEEWQGRFNPVFMKNTGEEEIRVSTVFGDFLIGAHECVLIDSMNMDARVFHEQGRTAYSETRVIPHGSLKVKSSK